MEEEKKLEVEGLGENHVPEVKGLNEEETVEEPVVEETAPTIDPGQMPPTKEETTPAFDPLSVPTSGEGTAFDPSATPVATGGNNDLKQKLPVILGIAGGVILIIAIIIIVLNSVGGKKLKCTKEESKSGYDMKTIMEVKMKGNTPEYIKATVEEDFAKDSTVSESDIDSYLNIINNSSSNQYEGFKIERKGKIIYISYTLEGDKLKSELGSDFTKKSIDEVQKTMEDQGYKCK